jgi:hypothetical protein
MNPWPAHATTARRLHEKLLYKPLLDAVTQVPTHELRLTEAEAADRLAVLGFADPDAALTHIRRLTAGVSRTATVQRALLPVVLHELADSPEPDRGLLAYRQVSDKLGSTPWYLRLLRDGGPAAVRLALADRDPHEEAVLDVLCAAPDGEPADTLAQRAGLGLADCGRALMSLVSGGLVRRLPDGARSRFHALCLVRAVRGAQSRTEERRELAL